MHKRLCLVLLMAACSSDNGSNAAPGDTSADDPTSGDAGDTAPDDPALGDTPPDQGEPDGTDTDPLDVTEAGTDTAPTDGGEDGGEDTGPNDGGGDGTADTAEDAGPGLCAEGAIAAPCLCGGDEHGEGYCCSGSYQDDACVVGDCPGDAVPAFPGAEGFGACTTSGGRSADTQVLIVSTLSADSEEEGSFPWALAQTGPRIIVFQVSGVIDLGEDGVLTLAEGDVTVAGQTAPGAGITLAGALYGDYQEFVSNIIIRHMRFRPTYTAEDGEQKDVLRFDGANILLDHVSLAWGVDESMDLYGGPDHITVQWSTFEANCGEGHSEGNHNYGLLMYDGDNGGDHGRYGSVHHNLFANVRRRNPAMAYGPAEIVNNLVYNFDAGFHHDNTCGGEFNLVGNYYRSGPEGDTEVAFNLWDEGGTPSYYFADNAIDEAGNDLAFVDNPWTSDAVDVCEADCFGPETRSETRHDFSDDGTLAITEQAGEDTYEVVLERAGAFPRDWLTRQHVQDVRDRTGIRDCFDGVEDLRERDLMAGLTPTEAPLDSDSDGLPDAWEEARDLDPEDGSDSTVTQPSGYLAIEEYINERADALLSGP